MGFGIIPGVISVLMLVLMDMLRMIFWDVLSITKQQLTRISHLISLNVNFIPIASTVQLI